MQHRLYDISQEYNIEIGAVISKVKGSEYLTVSRLPTTDFRSGSVGITGVASFKGDVATFHTHPGKAGSWNRFSRGDIATSISMRVGDYIASPDGKLRHFNYSAQSQALRQKLIGADFDGRENAIRNWKSNLIDSRGGSYVREFR